MRDNGNLIAYFTRQNRKLFWENVGIAFAVGAFLVGLVLGLIYWPA